MWRTVRTCVLLDYHVGAEEIEINGELIGLGKEEAILGDLIEIHPDLPPNHIVGAILAASRVPGWETPRSLRWFTSPKYGADNFHTALSLHLSSNTAPVLDIATKVAKGMRMPSASDSWPTGLLA